MPKPDAGTTPTEESVAAAQGLTEVSEADLMGTEDPESNEDPKGDEDPKEGDKDPEEGDEDPKEGDEDPKGDEDPAGDKDPEEGDEDPKEGDKDPEEGDKDPKKKDKTEKGSDEPAAPKSKPDKPPKGFVPTKALREARGENTFLKGKLETLQDQILALQDQIFNPPAKKEGTTELEPFEELSAKEYAALVEDSPANALIYMQKLNQFQNDRHLQERETDKTAQAKVAETQIMTEATQAMEKLAPGIFDKESEIHDQLVEFADTLGFSEDMFYLTNPGTQIILPGETEPLYLGDQAASMLGVLVSAQKQQGETAKKAEVSDDERKTLTKTIRAEVEKELMAKFKTDKEGTFKSLQQLSKANDRKDFGTSVLTDVEFAKLTDAEQEQYLSGA